MIQYEIDNEVILDVRIREVAEKLGKIKFLSTRVMLGFNESNWQLIFNVKEEESIELILPYEESLVEPFCESVREHFKSVCDVPSMFRLFEGSAHIMWLEWHKRNYNGTPKDHGPFVCGSMCNFLDALEKHTHEYWALAMNDSRGCYFVPNSECPILSGAAFNMN